MVNAPIIGRRARKVLKTVVEHYIGLGKPVGSNVVAQTPEFDISAATIRKIFSELEEEGLLERPHPSAGRVPTIKGYRYYAEALMSPKELTRKEKSIIFEGFNNAYGRFETLQERASRLLSKLSSYVGLVLAPRFEEMALQHIEFIRLGRYQILVVIVTQSMVIRNKIIRDNHDCDQADLDAFAAYLKERFTGFTLREMHRILMQEIKVDRDRFIRLFREFICSMLDCLEDTQGQLYRDISLDGAEKPFPSEDEEDSLRLQVMFGTLEQKEDLVRLLTDVIGQEGVQVRIGSDSGEQANGEFSLIASRYGDGSHGVGSLGIVGPTRLNYSKCVAMVDIVAAEMSSAMARNCGITDEP